MPVLRTTRNYAGLDLSKQMAADKVQNAPCVPLGLTISKIAVFVVELEERHAQFHNQLETNFSRVFVGRSSVVRVPYI